MCKSEARLVKFIIFLFSAVLVLCNEDRESKMGNENFFVYDTSKVDELVGNIKELNKKLTEIASIQQTNAVHLSKQINALKDQNSELSRKLEEHIKDGDEKLYNTIHKEFKEQHSMILENLNQLKCELSDSPNSKYTFNVSSFSKHLKNIIEESLATYSDCDDAIKHNGRNGVYALRVVHSQISTFKAYCLKDSKDKGPAWTIIQRRDENSGHFIDFNCTWEAYKSGFGDLEYDHWLGLDNIFALTNSIGHEFWEKTVDEKGEIYNDYYQDFKISDEAKNFTITSVNSSDSNNWYIASCLNTPFNTFDRGNATWVKTNGGGGYWGPCDLNFNQQIRENDETRIQMSLDDVHITYIHLAIRRKT